jgi:DNA-binding protein HU-beta
MAAKKTAKKKAATKKAATKRAATKKTAAKKAAPAKSRVPAKSSGAPKGADRVRKPQKAATATHVARAASRGRKNQARRDARG